MTSSAGAPGIDPKSTPFRIPETALRGRRPITPGRLWPLLFSCAFLCAATALLAEPAGLSALAAVKLLPKGASGKIAIIAAQEGKPIPERWYILVHDPKEENGLHEYVVANGEVVASRSISQFAEELKHDDVIGSEAIKIDSDRAAKIVQHYAVANELPVYTYNYELKKGGKDAAPIWHVTCLSPRGEQIGQIVLTATKGTVLSHDGFKIEPALETPPEPEKPKIAAEEEKKRPEEEKKRVEEERKHAEVKKPAPRPIAAATPQPAEPERPKFLQRVGGGLRNIFGGNRD
jgi:hypothetical protein